ncbi:MAG: BlaI/MecI/CopY family transcriptional regulator [Verrucomicrobiales bacterium]|nr:BlaI/MecI/CopY family transcriptional regulator [Verrucomicrobiales bacterium]MCP5526327.1 BlaI/MecI/CopY family transcriptional regulator [Verrucomicrobiales bacterium]
MAKTKLHRLGDLQLRIMQVLWDRGEATVAEVHDLLGARPRLAYTTVATMLRKMEVRGLVAHRTEGRTFVYRAAVAAERVSGNMAEHVLDRLFQGSLATMVNHLLTAREVSPDELAKLETLIAERKRAS